MASRLGKIAFILIIFIENLSGQCPERFLYWQKLQNIYTLSYDKQIPAYLELKKIGINCKLDNDSTHANLLFGLGGIYYYTQKYKESLSSVEQAIKVVINNPYRTNQAILSKYYYYLGSFQYATNDYKNAVESFKNCLEFGRRNNFYEYSFDAYQYIAGIYYNLGDYEKEIAIVEEGLNLANKLKINSNLYSLNLEKSKAYKQLNDYDKAIIHADKALTYAQKDKKNEIALAYCYFLQGSIYALKIDKYPKAKISFLNSIAIFKKLNDTINLSNGYINLGYFNFSKLKNYEEGLKTSELALKYCKTANEKSLILDNIGAIFHSQKEYSKALIFYQKALNTFPFAFKNSSILENPSINQLKIASNKEYVFSTVKNKADTWLDYYKFQPNKSHLQNALNTYKTADRMIDIMRWEQTGEQSKLFWRKKTRSIYQNAIETCYLLNKPEEAFYFFEKSRAVMLNDRLKELGAKQLLSPEDQTQESKLQQEVDNARKLVSENKTNNEENQQKLLNSENAQTAFFKQIELKNPTYYRYKYDTSAVNIKDLQQKLKDQTLVEYFVADSVVYAFVMSAKGMKLHQIKASNYGNISNEILLMMADENTLNKQFTRYLSLSNQFYKQFVEPLSLPKGRVIVSPDGTIVPFSALSFSALQAQYLVKDYAFGYTYSAKFLNQEKKSIAPKAFLGIAPVQFKNNQLKLTDSDLSLQRIAEHFSAPQLLLKEKATRKTFLETMGKYQVVQLYTHALANDTTAQLYLADSIIKASELTTKELLATELVVLSACQTGIGKDAKGEGVFSLSRSFAMLGIPSTLTTLWKVDNQATYQITELFYQYLDEGLSKDLALQKAQNEYLSKNTSGLTMPNFWAGYVLVGDNSPLEKHNQLIYWILGSLLLGGIGFYFKQKSPQKRAF